MFRLQILGEVEHFSGLSFGQVFGGFVNLFSDVQIPHWLPFGRSLAVRLFLKVQTGVSSGTLAFAYMFPAHRAMAGLAPASRLTCRSHQIVARFARTI